MADENEWLTLDEVAARLGEAVARVRQMLRDAQLAAVPRDGRLRVPAGFLVGDQVVKGLSGALTVLRDAGYSDEEAVRWLLTPDDSLPGTPLRALRQNRGREIRRRAQALAF